MNEALLYIVNSAAWSVGGLISGFFIGRMTSEVHAIKKHLEDKDTDSDNPRAT